MFDASVSPAAVLTALAANSRTLVAFDSWPWACMHARTVVQTADTYWC